MYVHNSQFNESSWSGRGDDKSVDNCPRWPAPARQPALSFSLWNELTRRHHNGATVIAPGWCPRYYRDVRRHRLIAFFFITFGLSWGTPGLLLLLSTLTDLFQVSLQRLSPLSCLFFWGPALSAALMIGLTQGSTGLRAFARRLVEPRFAWRWWLAVVLGAPLLKLLAFAIAQDTDQSWTLFTSLPADVLLGATVLSALEVPVSEFGWRGFALPLLQQHANGLLASVLLGVLWSLWYLPWLLPGTVMNWAPAGDSIPAIVRFFAGSIALSITTTVLYNGGRGSMPLVILFQWVSSLPRAWGLDTAISYIDTVIAVTCAVILIFVVRRRYLWHAGLVADVTPGVPEPAAAHEHTTLNSTPSSDTA